MLNLNASLIIIWKKLMLLYLMSYSGKYKSCILTNNESDCYLSEVIFNRLGR